MNSNWSYSPETPNLGQIWRFLEPCDLEIWRMTFNKANLRDLIAATGLEILLKLDLNHRFFSSCDLEIWWMTPNKANLRDLIAATGLVILLKLDLNRRFFSPCDLDIWWMTPKNNRAPLLCYFKLFASFRSHWWIQTGVTVRKRLIWVKINAFFSRVTLKFDGWPSKTIGHPFYVTSSFVQHFVAIDEFKLELQSGNA